jgi:penicillin amidase
MVTFMHPLGIVPELAGSFNIGSYEVGGDQTAINASEYSLSDAIKKGTFNNLLGPSMRMIVDLSNMNTSYTVNSTGQNGQPLHPSYSDQTRLWRLGDMKTTVMNETDMFDKNYNLLILIPEN